MYFARDLKFVPNCFYAMFYYVYATKLFYAMFLLLFDYVPSQNVCTIIDNKVFGVENKHSFKQ